MSSSFIDMNKFQPVKYDFNRYRPNPSVSLNHIQRIPLIHNSEKFKETLPSHNLGVLKRKPSIADETSKLPQDLLSKVIPNSLSHTGERQKVEPIKTDKTHLNEIEPVSGSLFKTITFTTSPYSRNLILQENGEIAKSKKYNFSYEGKTFAGVITDAKGHIYLYDRGRKLHRPLKHMQRFGDKYSAYHAGLYQIGSEKLFSSNYVDLGSLEVLQAAIEQSQSGQHKVKIKEDNIDNDGFLTNWMLATSPNKARRRRYWNDNVIQMRSKRMRNILTYALPAALLTAVIGGFIGLGVEKNFEAGINNDVKDQLGQTNNYQDFEVNIQSDGSLTANYEDGSSTDIKSSELTREEADILNLSENAEYDDNKFGVSYNESEKKVEITNQRNETIETEVNSSNSQTVTQISAEQTDKFSADESLLTPEEINQINNRKDVDDILNRSRGENNGSISSAGRVALATFFTALGAGATTYGIMKHRYAQQEKEMLPVNEFFESSDLTDDNIITDKADTINLKNS